MDHVPFDFLDKVFTKIDHLTIQHKLKHKFQSLIWNEVIRVYKSKIQPLKLIIASNEQELTYGFVNDDERHLRVPTIFTFDEIRQMDHRFKRVVNFVAIDSNSIREPHKLHKLPIDRLLDMIKCVCQDPLRSITMSVDNQKHRNRILAELEKHQLELRDLEMEYFPDSVDFLTTHMQKPSLQQVTLYGIWPSDFKEHLMAFVCRPQFQTLISSDYQSFDIEDINAIVAYSKTLETPWMESSIWMATDADLGDQFAFWMEHADDNEEGRIFECYHNKAILNVCSSRESCSLNFYRVDDE